MKTEFCHVSRWLAGLPVTCTNTGDISLSEPPQSRKRSRLTLTPPPSCANVSVMDPIPIAIPDDCFLNQSPMTPSPKKRRLDLEATPRPYVFPADSVSQAGSIVSASTDSSACTGRGQTLSRTSSPSKQLSNLLISNVFDLHFDEFDVGEIPETLRAMRKLLKEYTDDRRIIPSKDRESAPRLLKNSLASMTENTFYNDDEPNRYGPAPNTEDIMAVQANSYRCKQEEAAEVTWNTEVHLDILRLALRKNKPIRDGPVNFAACTSATIHQHLFKGNKRSQAKMVDFCLYIDADVVGQSDHAAGAALQQLYKSSRSTAVNHTDFAALKKHPIALSIESKTQDGSMAAATLQVGTWHAAQWTFLRNQLAKNKLDVATLEFLPGLIVQGSQWYFVASTWKDGKTTLWTSQSIGSTTSVIGTYRVIRSIQYLASWCREQYWPWFRANALDLDS
ncbi:hypothetical protein LY76DRAFT_417882 [Colletotrichum caudatum]|nr:hypothetical protein LY76DRAFT_417882 [Colletotrichum caudatum]